MVLRNRPQFEFLIQGPVAGCAAGGERSYLSTMNLTQICMNEWRMMQLPRIVYATKKDFTEDIITSTEVLERIELFSEEFHAIGRKLLA